MARISRRRLLKTGAVAAGAIAFPMIGLGRFQVFAADGTTYSARAIELVERSLVIDMLAILHPLNNLFLEAPTDDIYSISAEHLEKVKRSGIDVWHHAVGLGGPDVVESALKYVGGLNGIVAEHPETFRRVDSASDLDRLQADGKIGVIIGIQNADHFRTPDDVNQYYNLGQRVSQLTYNTRNLIGTGATDRADGGLSDFGAGIVKRMNEVGMAVDTSHCGDQTTLDAIEVSEAPVLITHSNCRALVDGHPRCKPDEVIKNAAAKGGVMGITGVRMFVKATEPTNIEHLLDHFDHVVKITGVEHVGIGSDMDADGYDDMRPELTARLKSLYKESYAFREKLDTDGFDHPKRVYDLTEGLIRRGYSDADIELILGGNFRRVLGQIWN